MTHIEQREFDAWIEVNVFGREDVRYEAGEYGPEISWDDGKPPVRNFTTDLAAAMAVLEKCCCFLGGESERAWTVLPLLIDGKYRIIASDTAGGVIGEKADTIPLAICLFAKKLFSK